MRRLSDGTIRNTVETLLKTTAKEVTKAMFSHIYGAVQEIVKHTVSHGAANKVITSTPDGPSKSPMFAQSIVVFHMKTPTFMALITKIGKRHPKIAVMYN